MRPVFLSPPDAVLSLLLCVPPFFPLPTEVPSQLRDCEIITGSDRSTTFNQQHVDFADVLSEPSSCDYQSVWSLYMGPVHVYETASIADRGRRVDTRAGVECARLLVGASVKQREQYEQQLQHGRVVRLLYIDDVNQLPVTVSVPREATVHMCAPTLTACFMVKRVTRRCDEIRAEWREVAEIHASATAAAAAAAAAAVIAPQTEYGDTVVAPDEDGDVSKDVWEAVGLQYVVALTMPLFGSLQRTTRGQ